MDSLHTKQSQPPQQQSQSHYPPPTQPFYPPRPPPHHYHLLQQQQQQQQQQQHSPPSSDSSASNTMSTASQHRKRPFPANSSGSFNFASSSSSGNGHRAVHRDGGDPDGGGGGIGAAGNRDEDENNNGDVVVNDDENEDEDDDEDDDAAGIDGGDDAEYGYNNGNGDDNNDDDDDDGEDGGDDCDGDSEEADDDDNENPHNPGSTTSDGARASAAGHSRRGRVGRAEGTGRRRKRAGSGVKRGKKLTTASSIIVNSPGGIQQMESSSSTSSPSSSSLSSSSSSTPKQVATSSLGPLIGSSSSLATNMNALISTPSASSSAFILSNLGGNSGMTSGGAGGHGSSKLVDKKARQRRKCVRRACVQCRNARKKCSEDRPCTRCISLGMHHLCADVTKKKQFQSQVPVIRSTQLLLPPTPALSPPQVNSQTRPIQARPQAALPIATEGGGGGGGGGHPQSLTSGTAAALHLASAPSNNTSPLLTSTTAGISKKNHALMGTMLVNNDASMNGSLHRVPPLEWVEFICQEISRLRTENEILRKQKESIDSTKLHLDGERQMLLLQLNNCVPDVSPTDQQAMLMGPNTNTTTTTNTINNTVSSPTNPASPVSSAGSSSDTRVPTWASFPDITTMATGLRKLASATNLLRLAGNAEPVASSNTIVVAPSTPASRFSALLFKEEDVRSNILLAPPTSFSSAPTPPASSSSQLVVKSGVSGSDCTEMKVASTSSADLSLLLQQQLLSSVNGHIINNRSIFTELFLQSSGVGIFIAHPFTLQIIHANERFYNMFGYSRHDSKTDKWTAIMHADSQRDTLGKYFKCCNSPLTKNLLLNPKFIHRQTGRVVRTFVSCTYIRSYSGQATFVVGHVYEY